MKDQSAKVNYISRQMAYLRHIEVEHFDDRVKRTIARRVFLLLGDFLKIAPLLKNELARSGKLVPTNAEKAGEIIREIGEYYEGTRKLVRDKFSAHHQEVDFDQITDCLFMLSHTDVFVIVDDVLRASALLFSSVKLNPKPPCPKPLGDNEKYLKLESKVCLSTSRLAIGEKNTVTMIPCSALQEKLGILAAISQSLTDELTVTAVFDNPATSYEACVFESGWLLAICDFLSLLDNIYRNTPHGQSLLDILPDESFAEVRDSLLNGDRDLLLEAQLRKIRNKLGAHVDHEMQLEKILKLFHVLDLQRFHNYILCFMNQLRSALALDIRTRAYLLGFQRQVVPGALSTAAPPSSSIC